MIFRAKSAIVKQRGSRRRKGIILKVNKANLPNRIPYTDIGTQLLAQYHALNVQGCYT